MRKRLSIVLTALCALFISCGGGLSQEGTGSISMDAGRVAKYLGQHANHSAIVYNKKNGNVVEGLDFIPPIKQEMKVGLSTIGSYTTSTEIVYSQKVTDIDSAAEFEEAMEQFYIKCFGKTITLEEIPVGSHIRVKAVLTISELIDEEEFRKKLPSGYTEAEIKELLELAAEAMDTMTYSIEGTSDLFKVHSGSNSVTIRMNLGGDEEEGESIDYSHPIILWNGRASESEFIYDSQYDKIIAQPIATYIPGYKAFSHIEEGMQITDDLLPSSNYCIGDGCIYVSSKISGDEVASISQSVKIEKYILNESGLVKTDFEIELVDLFNSAKNLNSDLLEYYLSYVGNFAYNDGYLYLALRLYNNTTPMYIFGVVSVNNPDKILFDDAAGPFKDYISPFTVSTVNGDIILCSYETYRVTKQKITLNPDTVTFGSQEYIDISDFNTGVYDAELKISDIQIVGNNLYIAVYAYRNAMNSPSVIYTSEEDTVGKSLIVSTGGIAKADLTASTFELGNWRNNTIVLGLYKGTYYKNTTNGYESTESVLQPPLSKAGNYFYGAKKFVAKKPDELVIADDGAYVDIDYSTHTVNNSINMNRVVTVNLATESISAVNVGVCFNATVCSGTGYGVSD